MELLIDYPSNIASFLQTKPGRYRACSRSHHPHPEEHHIVSDYCIGCDGEVASVCLFSEVPLAEISTILLDYQSRTSVALLEILIREHWKITPEPRAAAADYEKKHQRHNGRPGDRRQGPGSTNANQNIFMTLGTAWKEMTGLPLCFAALGNNKSFSTPSAFNDNDFCWYRHGPFDVICRRFI